MEYQGKLYGKAGRRYIPLTLTSDDVERIEKERDAFKAELENIAENRARQALSKANAQEEARKVWRFCIDTDPSLELCAGQHKETGEWHGVLYCKKPTPSGCDRWLLQFSDNRGWPDEETAKEEMAKGLSGDASWNRESLVERALKPQA